MTETRSNRHRGEATAALNPRDYLANLWKIPFIEEKAPEKIDIALRERIKELNCLYAIARLAERHHDSMENFLKALVELLPLSWQYPEITCARVVLEDRTYRSRDFRLTKWRQSAPILVHAEPVGEVTIFYLEERPAADEGPFLKEERVLIDEVATRIGSIAVRIAAEKELQEINKQLSLERMALHEANAAMRTVLAKIEDEKKQIYRDMQIHVEKVLIPILQALSVEVPKAQRKYVEILHSSLEEMTSPFIGKVVNHYHSLSPTEISICNMIRNGMRTKDIAKLRGVSPATVNRHRENIRKKLRITNDRVNLTTYLQSLA
ncbi:MAG: regulatory protein [Syntrophaceae bacterium PtaB.Bin038]|jgi:DNA-binding CsgD family transcriptional regulator|nr:MAG: regulatory protein [Syntrophaceae bacterium PtaB.Bin038]